MATIELYSSHNHELSERNKTPWINISARILQGEELVPMVDGLSIRLGASYPTRLRHRGLYEIELLARAKCQCFGIEVKKVRRL